jgi:hypothetical protein
LCEQRVETAARVFQPGFLVPHTEAHVGGLAGDAEFFEQGNKIGISPVVEHDKAGINRVAASAELYVYGCSVPAHLFAGLEDSHFVRLAEVVGATESRNT